MHLTGTPVWCDARRRRDVCFVSSADRVGRTGHGQLIGSPLTLALLGARGGGHLAVPMHRRFTLGTVRLELIASGRGPGSAALFADINGKTVLYAGAIRTDLVAAAGIEPAESRACEAVVVSAPFGAAGDGSAPLAETIAKTIDWCTRERAAGRRPVLLVDTALDGLEVALCLAAANVPLAAGRTIREAARRGGELAIDAVAQITARAARDAQLRGVAVEPAPSEAAALQLAAPGAEPRALIWLARDRPGLAKLAGPTAIAAVSGEPAADLRWPSAAGRADLLGWIETTGAREVYVTGAAADEIARVLGTRAKVIGPPQQMTLFEASP